MAFVYQAQRWIDCQPNNCLGPGAYNYKFNFNSKCGVISPSSKSNRSYKFSEHKRYLPSSQNTNIVISPSKQQTIKNQQRSNKKMIPRAMSAKLFATKCQFKQLNQTQNIRNQNIFLQITNSNNNCKKQFENSIIKKEFVKAKQSIHSNKSNQILKKNNLFNDKNLRGFQNKKLETTNKIHKNINFFQQCLTKSTASKSKQNLIKFRMNSTKNQNFFFTKDKTQKPKQNQNFIIASANCKKQRVNLIQQNFKKQQQNCKMSEYGDMQTTGIQDSLQSSFQYINDATPGPGQYNLRTQKPNFKSSVQKFGITQKRFKNSQDQQKLYFLNIKIPNFKKYSRASQQKVAFGKSRVNQTRKQQSEFIIYETNQTFEQKSLKNLIKDRKMPGSFLSKCDRFISQKKPQYFGPDFYQKQKQSTVQLPSSIFMSKVNRQQRPLSPTAQIDYLGQDCYTLQKKIEKIKQIKQMVQQQIPGFYVSAPRFLYKQEEQNQPSLKIGKRLQKDKKDLGKSYTFRKQKNIKQIIQISQQSPAPWTYESKSKWIKPSHHIRYKF